MIRFSGLLLAMWLVCPPAMATTSCDNASDEAASSDATYHFDEKMDWDNVRMGVTTPQAFRARSDARSSGRQEARIKSYRQNCTKGETIKMLSAWSYQVKELCDFNKSVLSIGAETLCVMQ
jgi:hypothetical protein